MEFTKDIQFNNEPIANQDVQIAYTGFLSDSSELSIVYGFGEDWQNTTEQKMTKVSGIFFASVKMLNFDTFNFCFKNNENVWDNNSYCNYISPIVTCKNEVLVEEPEPVTPQKFDIDLLIEEILQPLVTENKEIINEPDTVQIDAKPIDLGVEITKALSQIKAVGTPQDLVEFSSIDEILSGTVIEETPIEQLEQETIDNIVSELIKNTQEKSAVTQTVAPIENIETFTESNKPVIESAQEVIPQTALVNIEDPFSISPRQLSKFYLFRKRIKLALYKAIVKLPKLIFGFEKN